jgi:hypothetical protein
MRSADSSSQGLPTQTPGWVVTSVANTSAERW